MVGYIDCLKNEIEAIQKNLENYFYLKIFDQFFKSEDNRFSSGLGLFIVKEAVNKLRGDVTVKSIKNAWTEFTVVLPNQFPAS